jgi:phage FluMu protein Com
VINPFSKVGGYTTNTHKNNKTKNKTVALLYINDKRDEKKNYGNNTLYNGHKNIYLHKSNQACKRPI